MVSDFRSNLHFIWDVQLLQHFQNTQALYNDTQVFNWYFANQVTPQRQNLYFSTTNWTPLSLVQESFQLALQYAYNFTDYTSRSSFSTQYYDRSIAVVHEQISRNGMRLGALLNDIASKRIGPTGTSSTPVSSSTMSHFSTTFMIGILILGILCM